MSIRPGRSAAGGDRRGVALVLALWALLVLGLASLRILAQVRSRVDVATLVRSRTVARYSAESGVVAAQALLDEMVRSASSPAEQARVFDAFRQTVETWGERHVGSGRFQVAVEDLNARVDLNRSRTPVLQGLFRQFVSDAEAEALVRALRGSAGLDVVGAPFDAGELPAPDPDADPTVGGGTPRARPLMHLEELRLITGFGDSLAAEIAPYVTVLGDGRINVNTAPVPVLAAVPEIGEAAARSVVASRDRTGPLASGLAVYSRLAEISRGAVSARMQDLVTMPRRVLVVSRGWEHGHPYTHEVQAVFEVAASSMVAGSRVRPRFWTERGR
ncbi:MAG: type II secretion system protein GspK [Gemmatimonadota bacterium]|jgi:type II secretory pathway component PulK